MSEIANTRHPAPGEKCGMDEKTANFLFQAACELAYLTFNEPTDEHIIAVLDLIVFDFCCGIETTKIAIH